MTRRVLLLALVLLAGCTAHTAGTPTPITTFMPNGLPRGSITPGIIITTSKTDVCTVGWSTQHRRSLTVKQKTVVLRAYGYPDSIKVAEWDHLVSLELGGGNGVKNIWPQISDLDQERKDRLENALHRQVCTGQLSLAEAQGRIKEYWRWW